MDRQMKNIVMALTATVLSVELILVVSALLSRVPVAVDLSYVHSILWQYQRTFQPQRDLFLYGIWLMSGTAIFACLCWVMQFNKAQSKGDLNVFLMFHILIVGLMCHAGFEIVAVGNPVWAWPVFWGAFIAGVLISIFWPEFLSGVSYLKNGWRALTIRPWVGVVLGCLFIFLVIFMPDVQAVVAMQYLGDYFHNWDADVLGATYAIVHGAIPGIDVVTFYGFGASVILAKIVNGLGGFDYARLLGIVMWAGIIYFVLWFLLLRRFLASPLLAFAAVVCAMRMQMFNLRVEPIVWATMMASVFRFCFDIGVFWMLWMHMQTRRTLFLVAAAFFVSLGVFHMLSTGTYMFLVFVLYAGVSACVPCLGGSRNLPLWRNHALAIISVWLWAGLWFYWSVGTHLFEATFLKNLVEFNTYFIKGATAGSLTVLLSGDNGVWSLGGLIYAVFYMVTFFYVAGRVIAGEARGRDVFAGLLAFYGLENNSYYILMAAQWYTMGISGIFLFFYWIAKALEKAPGPWRKRIAWGLVVIALYCLVTDRLFTRYPNLLSVSRNPLVDSRTAFRVGPQQISYVNQLWAAFPETFKLPVNSLGEKDEQVKLEIDFRDHAALKAYYAQETAWPEDTALIRRLTPEGGKAAVLSSFEVLLLQKADRRPFFYYFPLINSRPLAVRNFMVTRLFSYTQLQKTLDQLEAEKPPYIFMERIFLTPQVPQAYFYEFGDLIALIRYCLSKYEPVEVGKYLVAMKRKSGG